MEWKRINYVKPLTATHIAYNKIASEYNHLRAEYIYANNRLKYFIRCRDTMSKYATHYIEEIEFAYEMIDHFTESISENTRGLQNCKRQLSVITL